MKLFVGVTRDCSSNKNITAEIWWLVETSLACAITLLLDAIHNHLASLRCKLRNSLKADRATDRRNVGKRLENLRVAGSITVVEEDYRGQSRVTGYQRRDNVGFRVGDVGRILCGSLERCQNIVQ